MDRRTRRSVLAGVGGVLTGASGCLSSGIRLDEPTDGPLDTATTTTSEPPTSARSESTTTKPEPTTSEGYPTIESGPALRGGVTRAVTAPRWYVALFTQEHHLRDFELETDYGEPRSDLREFVAATDLTSEFLLAVQAWVNSPDYTLTAESIEWGGDGVHATATIRERTDIDGSHNAEVIRTRLVRLPLDGREPPTDASVEFGGTRSASIENRYRLRVESVRRDALDSPVRYVAVERLPRDARSALREAADGEQGTVSVPETVAAILDPYDYVLISRSIHAIDVRTDGDDPTVGLELTSYSDVFRDGDGFVSVADLPEVIRTEVESAIEAGWIECRRSPRIVGTPYLSGYLLADGDFYRPTFEQAGRVPER